MALNDNRRKRSSKAIASIADNLDFSEIGERENRVSRIEGVSTGDILRIPLEDILGSPFQNNKETTRGSIELLADNIHFFGLINPIVVIEDKKKMGKYNIVGGSRRFTAYKLNKKRYPEDTTYNEIPAVTLKSKLSDEEAGEVASMIDNIFREPPTIAYIMSNIQLVLKTMTDITKEEQERVIKAVMGKDVKRKGRVEYIYAKLAPLNLREWSPATCRRLLNVMESGIDTLKEAFEKNEVTLPVASDIAIRDKGIQGFLLETYLKEGLNRYLEEIDKLKDKNIKKSPVSTSKRVSVIIKNTKAYKDYLKALVKDKVTLNEEELALMDELKTEAEEMLKYIKSKTKRD